MEPVKTCQPLMKIERLVMTQDHLNKISQKDDSIVQPTGILQQLKHSIKKIAPVSLKSFLMGIFPILAWLPEYSWKDNFVSDLVSGCTIAVIQIPQGMGFALLTSVSPIIGIYTSVFPPLVYILMGTSRHLCLGTLSIICLMTGKIVDQYGSSSGDFNSNTLTNETMDSSSLTNLEVVTIVAFVVGAWQIVMGFFHLGVVGIILSQHLVSGFTTAAAFHVSVSQLNNLLGLKIPRIDGAFRLVRSVYAIIMSAPAANPVEVIISSITIICLAVHNDWIKPWYSKKIKIAIPMEMLMIAVGTATSYYCLLNENYSVKILGPVPTGIPTPTLPPFFLIPDILLDSFVVALVVYALSLSMAKMFSRKCNYPIDNNQELLALGTANIAASFISCIPVSASPSRSLLQYTTGGKTQITNLISCILLIITLLWIGPVFQWLPLSVLAGVILVTLKGLFMQFKDLKELMKISPLDAVVWIACFLSTVLFDFKMGLIVGATASVSVLVYRAHCPHHCILGRLPETGLYVDISQYPTAVEEPRIKIFRWVGAIHFANGEAFRNALESYLQPTHNNRILPGIDDQIAEDSPTQEDQVFISPEHFICDFTALSYIDLVGSNLLKALHNELKAKHIQLSLIICSDHLISQLEHYKFFEDFAKTHVYPSIHDPIVSIKHGSGNDDSPNSIDIP